MDSKFAGNGRTDTGVPRIPDNKQSEIMAKLNNTEAAIGGELLRIGFAVQSINSKLGEGISDGPARLLVVSEEVFSNLFIKQTQRFIKVFDLGGKNRNAN